MMSENVPPDFLTVDEAALVLRIGRTSAYALAREFLTTGGLSGLPVLRVGRQLRVPRCRLEQLLGGPITWPCIETSLPDTTPTTTSAAASSALSSKPSRKPAGRADGPSRLFSV
jgi:Helix-turn-helix domain